MALIHPRIGIMAVQFHSNILLGGPVKYTIATLDNYKTGICSNKWLHDLTEIIESLNIDYLYVCTDQYNFLTRFMPKKTHLIKIRNRFPREQCNDCKMFSCSAKKIKVIIKDWYNFDLKISCTPNYVKTKVQEDLL
ncbi:hypothetical protein NPIL_619811 [Nephila pilipes]|uniref:Uncharacterized protein n=1 Tax=Nephila pilipes TaxID=299642 RepID=A0A8X6NIT8_NEPPI|nr:hypothetical protein NPIL_619811 [Nephila pilipes]